MGICSYRNTEPHRILITLIKLNFSLISLLFYGYNRTRYDHGHFDTLHVVVVSKAASSSDFVLYFSARRRTLHGELKFTVFNEDSPS